MVKSMVSRIQRDHKNKTFSKKIKLFNHHRDLMGGKNLNKKMVTLISKVKRLRAAVEVRNQAD